jgi:phosphopantetheinyl transferase
MPHPRLSLSHSGDLAVAVGLREAYAAGVGVDLERDRDVPPRAARFFLSESEDRPADQRLLLELWTVKEAVFKADLDNAGRLLRDYRVVEIHRGAELSEGTARRGTRVFRFRAHRLGPLTITTATRERTRP